MYSFIKTKNAIKYIEFNKNFTYLSVPYLNLQLVSIVLAGLPLGMDIIAPFFRGIKPYRDYNLLDEVLR